MAIVKRVLLGRPLASAEEELQRIPKFIGLSVFSSDAISSTAYATEEILFVTALGASSLVLAASCSASMSWSRSPSRSPSSSR